MNSRRQFIIEGIRQAGNVFVVSLLILLVVMGIFWLKGLDIMDPDSNSFAPLILCWIVGAVFSSILAGPVPWLLTIFDITDAQLLLLSCLLVLPYWALLGLLAGHGRWNFYKDRAGQLPVYTDQKISKQIRLLVWSISIVIAVLMFLPGPFAPRFGPGNRWAKIAVKQQVNVIENAKREFALAHQSPPDFVPTEADLSPYIHINEGRILYFGYEHYVINAITNPSYVILTNNWWIPRRGWQGGYLAGTNGQIFRLPR